MDDLYLGLTYETPEIDLKRQGYFTISGRSIPEHPLNFYQPLIQWFENYVQTPAPETVFDLKLEYFNSTSSKCILKLIRLLEPLVSKSLMVTVNWYAEEDDDEMIEFGQEYQTIINVPINVVVVDRF